MENNKSIDNTNVFKLSLSKKSEKECYISLNKSLIKLLYMIESERKDPSYSINLWFYGFMLDLISSNDLCDNKLIKVVVKMNSLYEKDKYKELEHSQIKRQIFESKGIIEHLIKELEE